MRKKLFECANCHITFVIYPDPIDVSNHSLLSTSHHCHAFFRCSVPFLAHKFFRAIFDIGSAIETIIRKQNTSYVMQDDHDLYLFEKTRSYYQLQMCNKETHCTQLLNLRKEPASQSVLVCSKVWYANA